MTKRIKAKIRVLFYMSRYDAYGLLFQILDTVQLLESSHLVVSSNIYLQKGY